MIFLLAVCYINMCLRQKWYTAWMIMSWSLDRHHTWQSSKEETFLTEDFCMYWNYFFDQASNDVSKTYRLFSVSYLIPQNSCWSNWWKRACLREGIKQGRRISIEMKRRITEAYKMEECWWARMSIWMFLKVLLCCCIL